MSEDKRREQVWLAGGALVGVLVAAAIVAVLVLQSSGGDATPRPATPQTSETAPADPVITARDDSLRAAEEAVVVLNTLDYRKAQQGLDQWELVATGALRDQLRARRSENTQNVEKARTASTAKVLAAAVARIAPDSSGTDVLAVVEVTVTDAKGATSVKQVREKLSMLDTGQGWKVNSIATVEPA